MAPTPKPTATSKPSGRTRRRTLMRKFKAAGDPSAIHRRTNKQLNRLIKLAAKERDLMTELVAAILPTDARGIQTDLEDVRRESRIIQSQVSQLQQQAATYLPYVHTPIDPAARPLPVVPTLDADQLAAIDCICYLEWKHPTLDKEEDLGRMKPYYPETAARLTDYWLNDAIVMEYLRLAAVAASDVFIVDSQITSDIVKGLRSPAAKYRKAKILSHRIVLFPICVNHHWTLAAWNSAARALSHYDSLNPSAADSLKNFKLFLNARITIENNSPAALQGLSEKLNAFPAAIKQENAVDCGVYVCMAARSIIEDFPFTFEAAQMNQIRKCMLYELAENYLLPFI